MYHSRSCRQVLDDCDFSEKDYRLIEQALLLHTPRDIVAAVRRKDPGGKYLDFAHFLPAIRRCREVDSMVPVDLLDGEKAERFWQAYDYLAQFVDDDFPIKDLELIEEMAGDMERLRDVVGRSKPNLRYVFKVWSSSYKQAEETNKPDFEIERHGVQTDDSPIGVDLP